MRRQFFAGEGAADERLDVFLARELGVARAQALKLIKDAAVLVNGVGKRPSYRMQAGDKIQAEVPETAPVTVEAPEMPVVYEDDDLLVVDKPAGLTVHPGAGTTGQPTAADFARTRTTDPDVERPGIVHRLDRDTSGLLIIAKNTEAKAYMQTQFRERKVKKTYTLLAVGRVEPAEAVIRLPTGRNPAKPLRHKVLATGRESVTRYQTLANYPGYTLLTVMPETGRTHQLRVHFAALGHPVAGDTTYGQPKRQLGLSRQFLHATTLEFTGPSHQIVRLASQLPSDLENVLHALAKTV